MRVLFMRASFYVRLNKSDDLIGSTVSKMKYLLAALFAFSLSVLAAPGGAPDIVDAAKKQIGVTLVYDPSYKVIAFPGGDVSRGRGVCTDVVVRALRDARKYDLQLEINKDMRNYRSAYPNKWGPSSSKLDSNIDHRRVPNIMSFLVSKYLPGDVVTWSLGGGLLHIGIVSDLKTVLGRPLVIHNIGQGTLEENILMEYRILGHYRIPVTLGPRG
jgi:uncharacterized protein